MICTAYPQGRNEGDLHINRLLVYDLKLNDFIAHFKDHFTKNVQVCRTIVWNWIVCNYFDGCILVRHMCYSPRLDFITPSVAKLVHKSIGFRLLFIVYFSIINNEKCQISEIYSVFYWVHVNPMLVHQLRHCLRSIKSVAHLVQNLY